MHQLHLRGNKASLFEGGGRDSGRKESLHAQLERRPDILVFLLVLAGQVAHILRVVDAVINAVEHRVVQICLLYTSDAADEL